MTIETGRLILRPWEDRDRRPFAEMSADPVVMEHLLPMDGREAADGWIDRQMAHLTEHGFCFWALETKERGIFVGAVGLLRIGYEAHFSPAVEVGWRISRPFWGQGYAPEAAAASIRFGFENLGLSEIVANTVARNTSSRRVMEKLGMSRDAQDEFDHPRIPEGHPLRRQILYRLTRERWTATESLPPQPSSTKCAKPTTSPSTSPNSPTNSQPSHPPDRPDRRSGPALRPTRLIGIPRLTKEPPGTP